MTPLQEDNYLACDQYRGQPRSDTHPDFAVFRHDGEFYFALLNDSDEVMLRSEGYQSAEAREKGIQSVLKNQGDPDRYTRDEMHGKYFVRLHAANHQEIARSCPLSEQEAIALTGLLQGPDREETVREAKAMLNEPIDVEDQRATWWWWVVIVLLLVVAFLWFRSCDQEEIPDEETAISVMVIPPTDLS